MVEGPARPAAVAVQHPKLPLPNASAASLPIYFFCSASQDHQTTLFEDKKAHDFTRAKPNSYVYEAT